MLPRWPVVTTASPAVDRRRDPEYSWSALLRELDVTAVTARLEMGFRGLKLYALDAVLHTLRGGWL